MNVLFATENRGSFGGTGQDTAKAAAALMVHRHQHALAPVGRMDDNDRRHAGMASPFGHGVDCLGKTLRETNP
jgi:hypothetical protein